MLFRVFCVSQEEKDEEEEPEEESPEEKEEEEEPKDDDAPAIPQVEQLECTVLHVFLRHHRV